MEGQGVEQWYKSLPPVTRVYLTSAFLTTAACALDLISPFTLYFNTRLIFRELQLWRLVTNFLFFGSLGARPPRACLEAFVLTRDRPGLDFLFHMFFLARYCRLLEEGSFRGRTADFAWMLFLGGAALTAAAPFVSIQFLGSSLTFMMVSFLGLFNFTAPYLPWVLLAFSWLLGSSPLVDALGIATGHAYYYLEDVYPRLSGRRVLATPALVRAVFPGGAFFSPSIARLRPRIPPPEGVNRLGGGDGGGGAGAAAGGGRIEGDGAGQHDD